MLMPSNLHNHKICGVGISVPIFFISVLLVFLFYTMSSDTSHSIPIPGPAPRDFHYKYTVEKGLFLQSEDSTDDTTFDFKKQNFGLINRNYPTDTPESQNSEIWPRFERYVRSLAASTQEGESVKVLFLARHGQGWHNVAETKYGTHAWDCYYSLLDGYDNLTWADAHLTPTGQQQARDVNALWEEQLRHGIPVPERFYVSPLTRTIQTADLSFQGSNLPQGKGYDPYIKELLREALGVHTCDRRSPRSHIAASFPHVRFEPGFSEADTLWEADYREPSAARRYRLATFLDDVFSSDEGVVLSFTSHSGAISSILEAVRHRAFRLETGGVIPVVVRALRVEGARDVPPKEPSEAPPKCDGPPEV